MIKGLFYRLGAWAVSQGPPSRPWCSALIDGIVPIILRFLAARQLAPLSS